MTKRSEPQFTCGEAMANPAQDVRVSQAHTGRKLNHHQACALLGCKKTMFYELIKQGKLTAYRLVDSRRGLWVYESDCLNLIKKSSASGAAKGYESQQSGSA